MESAIVQLGRDHYLLFNVLMKLDYIKYVLKTWAWPMIRPNVTLLTKAEA
jgi:hypothetical protein